MKIYLLSILLITGLFSESLTIYSVESAEYYASGSGSSGCCTPSALGSYNQTNHSTSYCTWWSQYGQCEDKARYALWRFDLSEIPENANIVNSSLLAQGGGNWIQSFMSISDYTGSISLEMASYLRNGGDWSISGQGVITSPVDQTIPPEIIYSAYSSGQLCLMLRFYSGYVTNYGANSPRIVIEYELENQECSDLSILQCQQSEDCEWVENIDTENCYDILDCTGGCTWQDCEAIEGCNWHFGTAYYDPSYCYGEHEVNNSYCEEIEMPECSEMNEMECSSDNSCEWIENIELENCNNINSQSECQSVGCSWYNGNYYACSICCWGEYEVDNSSCEEADYQLGDINQDYNINIQDIILLVNIVLDGEYNALIDMNSDQMLNVQDIILLVNIILN